jgi:hypothetical protein
MFGKFKCSYFKHDIGLCREIPTLADVGPHEAADQHYQGREELANVPECWMLAMSSGGQ